jgi:hypothetical protein
MVFRTYLLGRVRGIILFTVMMAMFAVPASATDVLYDNGPLDGTLSAWTINFGYAVADSFTLSGASTLTGLNFWVWANSGDVPKTVDFEIGTGTPFSSFTVLDSGTINLTNTFLKTNSSGFDLDEESVSGGNYNLGAGTYYLVLQNATTANSSALYWDINNGPSTAYESSFGPVKDNLFPGSNSDSFQILGTTSAPEPGTLTLLGTGLLFLVGRRRRTRH